MQLQQVQEAPAMERERPEASGAKKAKNFARKKFTLSKLVLAAAGLYMAFVVLCVLFPQWIAPFHPTQMFTDRVLKAPSAQHWFGTDYFGRDMFSIVVYGSRNSVIIGSVSVLLAAAAGGIIGSLAGYLGGVIDQALMRFIDVLMTIPSILLALAIAAALGPSMFNMILAISIAIIPSFARVMRGQVLAIRGRPYIEASRAIGMSHAEIFFRHVLPNSLSPILVMGTVSVGVAILVGSALSFLGLGAETGNPDWGKILSQGRGYLSVAWWIVTFPGLAVTLLVLSVNIIGDELRDRFDPRKSGN
jgi:peptide/nickel transport system permease protein